MAGSCLPCTTHSCRAEGRSQQSKAAELWERQPGWGWQAAQQQALCRDMALGVAALECLQGLSMPPEQKATLFEGEQRVGCSSFPFTPLLALAVVLDLLTQPWGQ